MCKDGKNKECLFTECSGRQWAGRQAVGAAAGAGPLGDPWGKRHGTGFAGSSGWLSQGHRLACSNLWGQAPGSPRCSDDDARRRGAVHSDVRD